MPPFRQAARVSPPLGVRAFPIVKQFRTPDELLAFDDVRLEVISVGGSAVAKASYVPGFRWSRSGTTSPWSARSAGRYAGLVLAGQAALRTAEGGEIELSSGDLFEVPLAAGYDLWVVGDHPCEILYLSGVEDLIAETRHRLQASMA